MWKVLYLLTAINEKFYKISFLSQILAMVMFCFPPISMKGTASNIRKTSVYIERYKWQTSYRTCINLFTSVIKRLATKKDLGPFKIDRAVVDSNRSVNLLFNIRKILCTNPRKRKDIVFKGFRSATCHSLREKPCGRGWILGQIIVSNFTNVRKQNSRINNARLH